jgi:predicted ATPase
MEKIRQVLDVQSKTRLKGFRASGILGSSSYRIDLHPPASIIVGPNGTGKSTFLSLFYLFISRQWQRLNEYDFTALTLYHSQGKVELTKSELVGLDIARGKRGTSDRYIVRLQEAGAFDLIYKSSLTRDDRERLASISGLPTSEVSSFRRYVQAELGFTRRGIEVDADVSALQLGEILYLPTYRRIEKDIKSIFPDIENRIRARIEEGSMTPRAGAGFKEIAGFGMGDVQQLVDNFTANIRDSQRLASETASQEYIRDIVTGKIRNYSLQNLRRLPNDDFEEFKNSLDEKLFSVADREKFRSRMDDLRKKSTGQPAAELRFLGMFVEKLLASHIKVKEMERPLRAFVDTVSSYLKPAKRAAVRGHEFVITGTDDNNVTIPLDKLSSGEKQIVSIFAYLLLSEQKDFILLIDEPELSLSVPWQKRFIPDLISTNSCAHILSVTHSPFVFDNDLRKSVVDVRRLRVAADE